MFHVGDIVKIKSLEEIINHADFVEEMDWFADGHGIVEEVIIGYEKYGRAYRLSIDNGEWVWYESMLEHDAEDEMIEENKMNEKFDSWLNGMMTVIVHTEFGMHFYWSSTDKSTYVEFSLKDYKEKVQIRDDEYDYNLSRQQVRDLFEKFLLKLDGVK